MISEEKIQYDVIIVGAGPAGLSCAIKLKQTMPTLSVCVLEKAASIGGHSLSGAVLETASLDALLPGWKVKNQCQFTEVTHEKLGYLTEEKAYIIPSLLLPPQLHNKGNVIISLSELCRFLGKEAEQLGVDVFAGFTAKQLLFDDLNQVIGIETGEMGVDKQGQHKPEYNPGMAMYAAFTLLAEGCRGSLSAQAIKQYNLAKDSNPQTYGLGIKEVWQIKPEHHHLGLVQHTLGWPLTKEHYGGGFIYHLPDNKVSIGLVTGLDYDNPYFNPFEEMQRLKTHPTIKPLLTGAKRIGYGARTITEGGLQALPTLDFPGGALMGCAAGLVNVAKIKGIHNAIASGMVTAKSVIEARSDKISRFKRHETYFQQSTIYRELYQVRNMRYYFKRFGFWLGCLLTGFDLTLCRGKVPWTLTNGKKDRQQLKKASLSEPIDYPKPDGITTFSRLDSLSLAHIHHDENQPVHLKIQDQKTQQQVMSLYDAPETRYCPAGVYEKVGNEGGEKKVMINAANCIHCKACDIKDPLSNIGWTLPEGGSGPNYSEL